MILGNNVDFSLHLKNLQNKVKKNRTSLQTSVYKV